MYGKITDSIYEVKLPLPGSSLKELSSYIVVGNEKNCVIDVGFSTEESKQFLCNAISDLGLDFKRTDLFITHTHRDHVENIPNLYQKFRSVICSQWDAKRITGIGWMGNHTFMNMLCTVCGIPQVIQKQIQVEEEYLISPKYVTALAEGEVLSYGPYQFQVVDLKGHMPGQIGLYDVEHKILFSGDHVLNKITPNISYYGEGIPSLEYYIQNLKKVQQMDLNLVLPSHRGEILNLSKRVDEILEHHAERLDEIMGILSQKPMCAYEVAGKVRWYYQGGGFSSYPAQMKWMATSEILAHLQYMCERKEICRFGNGQEEYMFEMA